MGAEATAERDEETLRGDELAAQLEQMTAARDTFRCDELLTGYFTPSFVREVHLYMALDCTVMGLVYHIAADTDLM